MDSQPKKARHDGMTDETAFADLIAASRGAPLKTAVVHPVDARSLSGALEARARGLIDPVLIGPEQKIRSAAEETGADLTGITILPVPHSHAAADCAVELVRSAAVGALMKGAIHTNELMAAVINRQAGLRTDRRMSHVFLMKTAAYPKPLLISDGAINIAPDLAAKRWIVQNAIDAARAIGIDLPKTAILSATEEVDPAIISTVDAAALCKMADRGQITGGILDGPLAFDLAVSKDAVAAKHLTSPVAGDSDILIVPTLEAGNMLAKQLDYLAGAAAAGIVMGASVPIILTSRADSVAERVASCAFAHRVAAFQRRPA
jgi:phosphotransacetylase